MRPRVTAAFLTIIALPLAGAFIQATKPEEVGLSSERCNVSIKQSSVTLMDMTSRGPSRWWPAKAHQHELSQ
jgi:hypothetical protein